LKTLICYLSLILLSSSSSYADEAADLEAKLKETTESSTTGGKLLLQLIDHYWQNEQIFGLIRNASKFTRAQTDHPQRAQIMLKLIEGYAATARHEDVVITSRQFLEIFPNHALENQVRDRLATALEHTGRQSIAASERDFIWRHGGETNQGIDALKLYVSANNANSFKQASALAAALVSKLPVNRLLTEVGIQGLLAAERSEQWAEGVQISKTLIRRKAPLNKKARRDLWSYTGKFEIRLGQFENATQSLKQAITPGYEEIHRLYIDAMINAKKSSSLIETEANRYLAAYPEHQYRYLPLVKTAQYAAENKELTKAITIAQTLLLKDASIPNLADSFVKWHGQDHQKAEQGLLKLIEQTKQGASHLRAILILQLYRDLLKNTPKARAMAYQYLAKSPTVDSRSQEIINLLYETSSGEESFKKDLQAVRQSATSFPHLQGFQNLVWNPAPKDKNHHQIWQATKKAYLDEQNPKLWKAIQENGGKSGQACRQLLEQKLSTEQRKIVLSRLAYVYRHHLGGKSRATAAQHYENLCREFPTDLTAGEQWLEASSYTDEKERSSMRLAAAKHLLSIQPGPCHYDTWFRLVETKDPEVITKAIAWISKSQKLSQNSSAHSTRIGDILNEIGMKSEASDWWKNQMDLDPNNQEYVTCAIRYGSTLSESKARGFFRQRMEDDTNYFGTYAGELANQLFLLDDLDAMKRLLSHVRLRANNQPFTPWGLGEWPTRTWLETARNHQEWTSEKKSVIYQLIRDLQIGRVSTEAELELLSSTNKSIDRLLKTQKAIEQSDPHYESWRRIFPYAQGAMAREDYTLGAGLLNGLLNTIRSVGNAEITEARSLLRKSYSKMGTLSSDIPADSPIAPLLQIILHRRLGDEDLAEQAYYSNKTLFDQHRDDLPVELILFGAETHIAQGTPEDHERAEDILRGWMLKFGESDKADIREKSQVQLLLARNYQRAKQYDIARAEFTTVLNLYKDQPEADDARFGIGETYMAQRVYDSATEIFDDLAQNQNPAIAMRANFLRGVLAIRQEDNQTARKIFLTILEQAPDTELANETLYNLAEVYGIEQRFLTQLETLRTVGRLGQESKLWHTPGTALSVVVQDPDLGISRGDTRIPVIVSTEPGNDLEKSFLVSGGAGKGIFLTEFPTILGEANAGDGILQVTGGDTISVDYPEDFKNQFQFEFLSNTRLKIASDGSLEVASSEIVDQNRESLTETLEKEIKEQAVVQSRSTSRPKNQVKPGNLIYMQVKDGDRDLTANQDQVSVKLTASSGDEVQLMIDEASQHGGVFQGVAKTGELPAGAKATDSALDHTPLMAIDHSSETMWRSEPDGIAPKTLSVDMKELRVTESISLTSPDKEKEAPIRMEVRGSHDGRFWFKLANYPPPQPAPLLKFPQTQMNLRVFKAASQNLKENYQWSEIVELLQKSESLSADPAENLSWSVPEESKDAYFLFWSGPFIQERDGAIRIEIGGRNTALMFNDQLVLPVGIGAQEIDLFAPRGIHNLSVFSIACSEHPSVEARLARENPQSSDIKLRPFTASDFDASSLPKLQKYTQEIQPIITQDENHWTLNMAPQELRYLEFNFLEYQGEAIAISNVEVLGGGNQHIPPKEDVLELARNETLELAPGDTVTVSYLDELTAGAEQRNRLLTQSLTATYYNGQITPIRFDFQRADNGILQGKRKELLRIEPGERIVAEVVDFDLDVSLERDTVEVEVQVNAEPPIRLEAIETTSSSGVFIAEIDTSPEPSEGKLAVAQGDKVYLRYKDNQNTFPGHAFYRESVVFLNEPTDGKIQIVESKTALEGSAQFTPVEDQRETDYLSEVEYRLPLTIEVIDPDQAKDSSSTVTVDVQTSQGTQVQVECVLSRAFAAENEEFSESRNPALLEGRFVGQIPLLLGGLENIEALPGDGSAPRGGLGRVVLPTNQNPEALLDDGSPAPKSKLAVLNVLGTDTMTASYQDSLRPDEQQLTHRASAKLASAAQLEITNEEYLEPAEILYVGKKIYLLLEDPDLDISDQRDKALVRVLSATGEDETLELEETLTHSGVFSASFPLLARPTPVAGNSQGAVECFFGDEITAGYLDNVIHTLEGDPILERKIPVAVGTDGIMNAFSKVYKNEDLAIQTQFHIAESYFELFKSHRKLKQDEEAQAALSAGRRVLRELRDDYPNPKYSPRISYLLGQFAQEMNVWDEAIAAYRNIVRNYPEHHLAPDSQYKLGQCHEEAGELDEALEAYVTLAGTYPKSPLIANVMLRINEHFYTSEDYQVAASVGAKFIEKFPNHEWTPKMAFRIGQCYYKLEDFTKGGESFDVFVKKFPDQELTAQALFWAGESYRMAKDIPNAFRRYNRCRWDFPESDAAKYSRGRLALPELLAQFEREANLTE
jgi:TolA-binding protein